MKVKVFSQKGKELEEITLKKEVFDVDVNQVVLSQYVFSYLSNQRESNAHSKTRAEVSGGGKKPWRQKGTGRARFGSSRNPIWTGGGVSFGPRNNANYKKAMTKKFKLAAMRNALSLSLDENTLNIVDKFEIDTKKPMAKQAVAVTKAFESPKKVLVVTNELKKDVINAFSNVKNAKVTYLGELSVYDILTGGKILIEKDAVTKLSEKLDK